uniref:Uncharacterized protein n=1 Tax=Arundo donax TaxID=35708 RepID=A0A0A8YCF1_ARUDO
MQRASSCFFFESRTIPHFHCIITEIHCLVVPQK